jgi:WD40 repeat protein
MRSRSFIFLCIILLSTSCQAGPTPGVANTAERPSPTRQSATAAAEITPLPTSASDSTAEPTRTNSSVMPAADVKCFLTSEGTPIAFLPDSKRLVIKERSGVKLFNLDTMEQESFMQAPQDLAAVALSPDGEQLAWSLMDNTIQLVRVADQKPVKSIKVHEMPVLRLIFSSEGDRLFSASYDTWVRIWDRSGEPLDAIQPTAADGLPNEIEAIAISPDDTLLGSVPFDGPTKVWDLAKKKEVANLGNTGGDVTSDIAFSPDGNYVAVNTLGRLSLWTISDWKMVWDKAPIMAFAFSPDSHVLAYSEMEDNSNVTLHPLVDSQNARTIDGGPALLYRLVFSPDGALLASAGEGIQIWQVDTGQLLYTGKATCP